MAIMIPTDISPNISSNAEKYIFLSLKKLRDR